MLDQAMTLSKAPGAKSQAGSVGCAAPLGDIGYDAGDEDQDHRFT